MRKQIKLESPFTQHNQLPVFILYSSCFDPASHTGRVDYLRASLRREACRHAYRGMRDDIPYAGRFRGSSGAFPRPARSGVVLDGVPQRTRFPKADFGD